MNITIKYSDKEQHYNNKSSVIIGNSGGCDFIVADIPDNIVIKLLYNQKYNNYVLVNSSNSKDVLFNNKEFSKVLVPAKFSIKIEGLPEVVSVEISNQGVISAQKAPSVSNKDVDTNSNKTVIAQKKSENSKNGEDIFDNDVETNRIAIIKEIGYKITELKNAILSANITSFMLNSAILLLSVVSAFGVTNFLLGLKVDSSSSVLNLTTNVGFLACISIVILAISLILKHGVYSILEFNQTKMLGDSDIAQKSIIFVAVSFMFIVYVINLFYYKGIPGYLIASFFISLLFVGALTTVAVASGYFKFQIKNYNSQLTNCEYREDFESVMKSYRVMINTYVNKLSQNRINSVKGNLLNNQLKMIVETVIGILTAPFLAYGVSNTLASCFPEAANWVRISGLRFSPIFLVLATFLIIFAFFSFVRGFTISKQIKGSEIIKMDGFHDYNSHGVTVLGLDSMRSLGKEKNVVLFIACFIILIEFTMNMSYFITEIGGDIQGMFLSFVTALVPTALLIAETHLLSSTMYKINNYNELLSMLD